MVEDILANGKKYKLNIGELVRLEIDDTHYYYLDKQYYIGVTTILGEAAPIPFALREWWMRNTKEESEEILAQATSRGSNVHNACEQLLKGEEVDLSAFTNKEKKGVVSFADWFRTIKPQNVQSEQPVASKEYRYAGTLDILCQIDDRTCIVDIKTSSAIHYSHKLQVLAYKQAVKESLGIEVDDCYILRVGTTHKGTTKKEGIGKGWEFKKVDDFTLDSFLRIYNTYLDLHDGAIPEPTLEEVYPEKIILLKD